MSTSGTGRRAPTARQRARAEITAEILAAARSRLTEHGPGELSLRAVARDVGMVSSAVYRYFAGRDELLTALLLVAYNELGESAEAADAAVADRGNGFERWMAACRAIRAWALGHPGDYALLYGSPVPGYTAPEDTIAAATRVVLTLVHIVLETGPHDAAMLPGTVPAGAGETVAGALAFLDELGLEVPGSPAAHGAIAFRLIAAWSALFGTISFELFGHLVGSVDDNDRFFEQVVMRLAADLGLDSDE